MDIDFIRNRITELRLQKRLSERDLSLSLGKGNNYINTISSGNSLPSLESLFEICDFFNITPYEFFFTGIENPTLTKEIYEELKRLCKGDLEELLVILKSMTSDNYFSLVKFLNTYHINKNSKNSK